MGGENGNTGEYAGPVLPNKQCSDLTLIGIRIGTVGVEEANDTILRGVALTPDFVELNRRQKRAKK